jgi:FKBP-type peptidyl-prolyl cis-trans isomerase
MTRKRDRFFAGFGALLFLLSASAVTVVAVASSRSSDNSQADTSTSTACQASSSLAATALPLPDVYKPTGTAKTLQVTQLEAGNGASVKSGDCLEVKYLGTLAKDGTTFDENFDKPTGFQFPVGQGQVIPGWDQGLIGTKVGETVRLVIPSALGYGAQGTNGIPANADLVFVVKILGVTK